MSVPAAEVAPRFDPETEVTEEDLANAVRVLSVDAIERAKSGHPGLPMGMATAATILWTRYLSFDPTRPYWYDRDRFVLSAGHGSMLLYALLYLTGYEDVTIDEIRNFRQLGSKTPGHPEFGHTTGVETTTGPLAQGLGNAVGMALAERLQNRRWGDDIVSHYTYCIVGDGCLMEGLSHEAISLAGALGLSRLIVLWDDNEISIDGPMSLTSTVNQCKRFEACGWDTQAVDGEDPEAVARAIASARKSNMPSLIACRTTIGKGAPTKAGTAAAHGSPLGEAEVAGLRLQLNWHHPPFEIPEHILSAWRHLGERNTPVREAWERRFSDLHDAEREEFRRTNGGRLGHGWEFPINEFKRKLSEEQPKWATRKASGEILDVMTEFFPELIGGSADLSESVNTKTKRTRSITAGDASGRYIHYGVREHAMAAAMNGMALHGGFIPYGGTFLVFADYMRSAIRMSALMKQRVIYVLTHDSIGVGEDGPTHHPVSALSMLRSMPNLLVFRPADAVETVECWLAALRERATPSCMILTRQAVPTVRTQHEDRNRCARGAYVLSEPEGGREVTLLSTGSEVSLAVEAAAMLAEQGIRAAVVSMPCWELFYKQPEAYRQKVLGDVPRIGIEAAVRYGWIEWIGVDGAFVGMHSFSASAPAETLYRHFDITADAVVRHARRLLAEKE